jgi:hypothetical protein
MMNTTQQGEVLPINRTTIVNDYPYGSLRAEARFSVEFNPKFGFRHIFQTVNPKNGRVNNPKKSTYGDFCYKYVNSENGHVESGWLSCNGVEYIKKTASFLAEHFDTLELTEEMKKFIYTSMYRSIKISQSFGAEEEKPNYLPVIETIVQGAKTGTNVFAQIAAQLSDLK